MVSDDTSIRLLGSKGEWLILCEAYLCYFCGLLCVCRGVWNIGDLDFLRPRGGGVAPLLEDYHVIFCGLGAASKLCGRPAFEEL